MGVSGTLINIHFEVEKRDQNLQNIAEAVASSPLIDDKIANPDDKKTTELLNEYLDSLKISLDNIDVISFVCIQSLDNFHLLSTVQIYLGTARALQHLPHVWVCGF